MVGWVLREREFPPMVIIKLQGQMEALKFIPSRVKRVVDVDARAGKVARAEKVAKVVVVIGK